LDTDHISVLRQREQPACTNLELRLSALPPRDVKVSVISFQEQAQGWLAWLRRAREAEPVLRGYRYLRDVLDYYSSMPLLPFEADAFAECTHWQRARIRIGTLDLRIAAIAKVAGIKLLSRNLRDFRKVPGLDVEDWTG
jgi:tRNA(fMet)-specific endonuclease VapC